METTTVVALVAVLLLGLAVGLAVGLLLGGRMGMMRARLTLAGGDDPARREHQAESVRLAEHIARIGDQLADLHHDRAVWQGELSAHVEAMRQQTGELRQETHALASALRRPSVRGQWGELHLRRACELAGMVERCDFTEQTQLDSGQRPDLVVQLAGGRQIAVDAKVPLDAFLDAAEVGDSDSTAAQQHLARHAARLRAHITTLGGKRYWSELSDSTDFVVLFLPGEAFLTAALEADPTLWDHAATRQIVLATPATLIALLRTVALGWRHAALTDRAHEVERTGRELHQRLLTWTEHLSQIGRSLGAATRHYNSAVGSLDARVLVAARRLGDLGVSDDQITTPALVTDTARDIKHGGVGEAS